MDTARAGRADAAVDGPAALPLVRAAAALRWTRPDLTATLAELALESAPDAETWVAAAGWLLHGRAALGDGRDTASALLDGLARWGDVAAVVMRGPEGRRLRVELAGLARRIGEASVARTLLASVPGADEADPELRADALTEFARCAVDDAPDSVDGALSVAEEAWRAVGCAPGVASVTLLRAARSRRAARADAAAAEAVDGLATVDVRGRRAGATAADHVAAALTAEWIAALVDGGRLDEARGEGLAAANRLVATARPSRQVAGLRLAIARLTAVEESPDAVLAALEPAAQAAADSDVPELESACRSMLGELHEAAGRLDAAVAALRGAITADRRDRDRAAHLRAHLAGAAERWAGGPAAPGSPGLLRATAPDGATRPPRPEPAGRARMSAAGSAAAAASDEPVDQWRDDRGPAGPGGSRARDRVPSASGDVAGRPVVPASGTSRRARRLAAEAMEDATGGGGAAVDGRDPCEGCPSGRGAARSAAEGRGTDAGRTGTVGPPRHGAGPDMPPESRGVPGPGAAQAEHRVNGGGSLIGDALLRELSGSDRAASGELSPPTGRDAVVGGPTEGDGHRAAAGRAADDPLFGPLRTDGSREPERGPVDSRPVDAHTVRWDRSTSRTSSIDDTVVLGAPATEPAHPPTRRSGAGGGGPAADPSEASGPTGGTHGNGGTGPPTNGTHRNGAVRPPQDGARAGDPAATADTPGRAAADDADGFRSAHRGTSGRGPGRPPSTDTDGLGLADLLAGALAAYRDL